MVLAFLQKWNNKMGSKFKKIALLFPGQGAQYCGMGKDFFDQFAVVRQTYEEADDLLKRSLSTVIFKGPEELLTQTQNSQTGIFVTSIAIAKAMQELCGIQFYATAGLSLGEYSALVAGQYLNFAEALQLVDLRSQLMNLACENTQGAMIVVMGMEADAVKEIVNRLHLPQDLWVANLNCPGQVVLSGTLKGIQVATMEIKERGAKRVIPLQVQGAFHSGLMQSAQRSLEPALKEASFKNGSCRLVMNVPGDFVNECEQIKRFLIQQVTHSVLWEKGIRALDQDGVDLFVEFGPGKTLSGLNKRIGVTAETISIEKLEDLESFKQHLGG